MCTLKLSFIIPFYNGGKYIKECLNSLYQQDMSEENYEVIVVNDCSTDRQSLDILYAYQKQHSNIQVLHTEKNVRVGGARNHGIRNANGKYIWFIDQDDKIEPNCLAQLLERVEKNELDYLGFDFLDFDDNGNSKPNRLITNDTDVMTGLEYAYNICDKKIWNNQWDTNVWHQIYRLEFLLKYNIFFTEISYFDDMIVNLKSLMYAKRIQTLQTAYYHYRYNAQSVLHSEVGYSGRTVFDASISASLVLLNFSKEIKDIDTYFSNHFLDAVSYRANSFTKALLRISHKQQRNFYQQVKHYKDWVKMMLPYLTTKNKILIKNPWIAYILHPLVTLYRKVR